MLISKTMTPTQTNFMRANEPSLVDRISASPNLKLHKLLSDVFEKQGVQTSSSLADKSKDVYSLNELIEENESIKNASSSLNVQRLSNEFLSLANEEGINIADFLSYKKLDCKQSLQLLYNLSSQPDTAIMMVEGLISEPTESKEIYRKLVSSVVSNQKESQLFKSWYYDEISGYKKAYITYYEQKLSDAESLEEIVKLSPNSAPWTLLAKANELGTEFTIGELPEDVFPSLEAYRDFVKSIKNLKSGEERDLGNGDSVKLITGSKSAKRIYKIKSATLGDYILKVDPCRPEYNDKTRDSYFHKNMRYNQDLKADMPFLNAMIDFYLKLNGYENNVANVQFYDHATGSILYKSTSGDESIEIFDPRIFNNLYLLRENPIVKSFEKVGIYLNDIHNGNFIKDENGSLVLIDSGHAEFNDPLKPLIEKQIKLSNLCGHEVIM